MFHQQQRVGQLLALAADAQLLLHVQRLAVGHEAELAYPELLASVGALIAAHLSPQPSVGNVGEELFGTFTLHFGPSFAASLSNPLRRSAKVVPWASVVQETYLALVPQPPD